MPLAGQFCLNREEAIAAAKFPLTWVQCARCKLVQVHQDVPDSSLYTTYNYGSSTVTPLVRHFDEYAEELRLRYGNATTFHILEIGCNDGVLLRRLPSNWRCVGVDPSDVARKAMIDRPNGYSLINQAFTSALS